jgi:hypothetical protein
MNRKQGGADQWRSIQWNSVGRIDGEGPQVENAKQEGLAKPAALWQGGDETQKTHQEANITDDSLMTCVQMVCSSEYLV